MRKRKWDVARTVNVPRLMTGDEKIWWVYSLCLVINRSCPEYFDDDEVSSALNKMAARLELPHGFNFATWESPQ
ncbi:MAG TPA: hypothetical protein VN742_01085 [Candidatus Binataceae bacterium]|nr:hypothetical protein [Candidatus Binataceae bacterium]